MGTIKRALDGVSGDMATGNYVARFSLTVFRRGRMLPMLSSRNLVLTVPGGRIRR